MDLTLQGRGGVESHIFFGSFKSLRSELDPEKTVFVTDTELLHLHGDAISPCPVVIVKRGEEAKDLASLELLYNRFFELGLGRDASVVALGGGSVSDLAGFAAATWLRGVAFGFVPTTLLAMVDASVGGKNGIDFRGRKNLIGTFAQARFVLMDVSLLSTLPDADFASGMAEAIKHAVIGGGRYFELIEGAPSRQKTQGTLSASFIRPDRDSLEKIIEGSVLLKAGIVSRDERESGERRKLNLGHTIGHGIESATGLSHGHSIAAGLASECRFFFERGRIARSDLDRITRLIDAWGLPASIGEAIGLSGATDDPALRRAITEAIIADKKRIGESIVMAVTEAPGSLSLEAVPLSEIQAFTMEAP